jgi:Cu/Ag efflux protein CusF
MKPAILTILAFAVAGFSVPALAASGGHEGHGAMHAPATAESPLTDGVVKKVDKSAGKVTVSHGPLPNGMPAMTMVFRLKDAAWFSRMKEGQKIRFAAADLNGAMTVVRFEPVE